MPRLHQIIAMTLAQSENLQARSKRHFLPRGLFLMADCSGSRRKLFFMRLKSDSSVPRTDGQKAKMIFEARVADKSTPFPVGEPFMVSFDDAVGYVFLEADSVPVQDNEGTTRLMSVKDKQKADAATAAFSDRDFSRRVEFAVQLKLELCPQHPDSLEWIADLWRDGLAQFPNKLEAEILEMQTKLESQKKVVPVAWFKTK